jgi:hypothetical protein
MGPAYDGERDTQGGVGTEEELRGHDCPRSANLETGGGGEGARA